MKTEPILSDEILKARKYPLRELMINIILNRINEAFSDGFHNNENKRLTDALRSIKELIPPDQFVDSLSRNPEKGVWGLDTNWNLCYHESDLSKVMKAEDCLYIASDSLDMCQFILHYKK